MALWIFCLAAFIVLKIFWTAAFCSWSAVPAVIAHGLGMEACTAAYCAALPTILSIALIWSTGTPARIFRIALATVLFITALIISVIYVADAALYPYWHCRLDSTAVFYALGWPREALASATWIQLTIGIIAIAALTVALFAAFRAIMLRHPDGKSGRPLLSTATVILWAGVLFIFIRGGFTVSTMNPGRVYFSSRAELNHAALNPAFSLLHSLTHGDDYGKRYNFMTDAEAEALRPVCLTDTVHSIARPRTDVYLIILESFSSHLLPCMQGDSVALCLDSLARRGLLFTNIYASSFRTDRALPAILNGTPAQPSTSVIKFTEKTARLPGLARSMARQGYDTEYYYGGDADFTNMRALLINSGFGKITSDKDFPLSQRISKWGVNDGDLFARAAADAPSGDAPVFRVIQTSSSHEPFDVPYANAAFHDSPEKNAFAYADSCLGDFVRKVTSTPRGAEALFVMVPDHQGAYPRGLADVPARHHIPLVFLGKHIPQGMSVATVASQNDLAATLLGILGIGHDDYPFSHDILSGHPARAYFTEPSTLAMVTDSDTIVYDPDGKVVLSGNADLVPEAQAWLQRLYHYLDSL